MDYPKECPCCHGTVIDMLDCEQCEGGGMLDDNTPCPHCYGGKQDDSWQCLDCFFVFESQCLDGLGPDEYEDME
jgi:hypothetical protein